MRLLVEGISAAGVPNVRTWDDEWPWSTPPRTGDTVIMSPERGRLPRIQATVRSVTWDVESNLVILVAER